MLSSQSFEVAINLVQHQHDPQVIGTAAPRVLLGEDLYELKEDYAYKLARGGTLANSQELLKKNFDKTCLAASLLDQNTLKIFHLRKNVSSVGIRDESRINMRTRIENFKLHPGFGYMLIGTMDGDITVYNLAKKHVASTMQLNVKLADFDVDPSGLYLVATGISPKVARKTLSYRS